MNKKEYLEKLDKLNLDKNHFDMNKKNRNSNIGKYCQNYQEVCQLMERIKKLHLKDKIM